MRAIDQPSKALIGGYGHQVVHCAVIPRPQQDRNSEAKIAFILTPRVATRPTSSHDAIWFRLTN
jgi:hypothetical protein